MGVVELSKGRQFDLKKKKRAIEHVFVGINWGSIKRNILFGLLTDIEPVDLDSSVAVYDAEGELLYIVYFDNLQSYDGAIEHSGDDRDGRIDMEDQTDNEVITIDFNRISSKARYIALLVNSFDGHDFKTIPFTRVRIFEGSPNELGEELSVFETSQDRTFRKKTTLFMGLFALEGKEWSFQAVGEPLTSKNVEDAAEEVRETYL